METPRIASEYDGIMRKMGYRRHYDLTPRYVHCEDRTLYIGLEPDGTYTVSRCARVGDPRKLGGFYTPMAAHIYATLVGWTNAR